MILPSFVIGYLSLKSALSTASLDNSLRMNTSTLFPPDRQRFSDTVIGAVDQRFRVKPVPSKKSDRLPPPLPAAMVGHKRFQCDTLDCHDKHNATEKAIFSLFTEQLIGELEADAELKRERNRIHQARYKKKQRDLVLGLENSVQHLKQELQKLELQHGLLSYRFSTNTSIWGVAVEYFRLFRYGVKNARCSPSSIPSKNQTQWHFMQTMMAEDVTDGVVFGVDAMMESMIFQSKCYTKFEICPLCMEKNDQNSLIVSTISEFTISEDTLYYGFPNLMENGRWSILTDKMIGNKIVAHGSTLFKWDCVNDRVTQLYHRVDLFTPLLKLLGNLEDVARVFDNAKISPEGLVNVTET